MVTKYFLTILSIFFFQDMFFLGFSGKSDIVTNNKSKNAGEFDEIV